MVVLCSHSHPGNPRTQQDAKDQSECSTRRIGNEEPRVMAHEDQWSSPCILSLASLPFLLPEQSSSLSQPTCPRLCSTGNQIAGFPPPQAQALFSVAQKQGLLTAGCQGICGWGTCFIINRTIFQGFGVQYGIRKPRYVERPIMNSLCETSEGCGIDCGLWWALAPSASLLLCAPGLTEETRQYRSFPEKTVKGLGKREEGSLMWKREKTKAHVAAEPRLWGIESNRHTSSQSSWHRGSGHFVSLCTRDLETWLHIKIICERKFLNPEVWTHPQRVWWKLSGVGTWHQ